MKSLQVGALRMTGSNFLNMKGDDNLKIMRSTASLKNKTSLQTKSINGTIKEMATTHHSYWLDNHSSIFPEEALES